MDEFEENVNCESKRPKRESEFASVNDLVHKWFVDASASESILDVFSLI